MSSSLSPVVAAPTDVSGASGFLQPILWLLLLLPLLWALRPRLVQLSQLFQLSQLSQRASRSGSEHKIFPAPRPAASASATPSQLLLIRSVFDNSPWDAAPAATVQSAMPMVFAALRWAPPFLSDYREPTIQRLCRAARSDPCVAQALGFALSADMASPELGAKISGASFDAGTFFHTLAAASPGDRVAVPADLHVTNPFPPGAQVTSAAVVKTFSSNCKPVLVQLSCAGEPKPVQVILKRADVRTDLCALQVFAFMNQLWQDHKLRQHNVPVAACTYGVVALSRTLGAIEFVPHAACLAGVNKRDWSEDAVRTMAATAAGSFIAGFVVGAGDRHYENILVRLDTGAVFQIDFGHVLGSRVALDTGTAIAVTPALKDALGPAGWASFVDASVKAFAVLRSRAAELIQFADLVFRVSGLPPTKAAAYMQGSLMLDLDLGEACTRLRRIVEAAPADVRTRLKNQLHGSAQLLKSVAR
jgi:hypothetical protein